MDVLVCDDAAAAAAQLIAEALDDAVHRLGEASVAFSGGSTAPPMLTALLELDVAWDRVGVWQVDERVAPDGDRARNVEQLAAVPAQLHPMPVTAADLELAAQQYAAALPEAFDVVHLGLGLDGHTASWPPDEPWVRESGRCVEVTGLFAGYRRMTLTPRAINAARRRVVLAVGDDKAEVVARWIAGAPDLPASSLVRDDTTAVLDRAAASRLSDQPR